jgi:hypothetical protein
MLEATKDLVSGGGGGGGVESKDPRATRARRNREEVIVGEVSFAPLSISVQ